MFITSIILVPLYTPIHEKSGPSYITQFKSTILPSQGSTGTHTGRSNTPDGVQQVHSKSQLLLQVQDIR